MNDTFEMYVEQLGSEELLVGDELLTSMKKVLITVLDRILGVLNSLKTNFTKFSEKLKRSELKYFNESNRIYLGKVFGLDYSVISNTQLPLPEKMSVKYADASERILKFIQYSDMLNKLKSMEKQTGVLVAELFKSPDKGDAVVRSTLSTVRAQSPEMSKQFTSLVQSCFKDTTIRKTKIGSKLFSSTEELASVNKLLLSGEPIFQEVFSILKLIESIESWFDKLLDGITSENPMELSKQSLKYIAGYCTDLAKLCDMYGIAVLDLHRVEHNYVMVMETLKKKIT